MRNIGKSKTTEQYWKDRFSFIESLPDRTEREMLNHLKTLYQNSTLEINKEVEAFYGRYAKDNNLTLSEVKQRLNPKELESAKKEIAKYYSEIDRLARTPSGKVSVKLLRKYKDELRLQSAKAYMSRLEDLKMRIRNSLIKMGVEETNEIHKSLLDVAEYGYTKSAYELGQYMGFSNAISSNEFENIVNERWLGENYSDRVWKNKRMLEESLEKTFLQGVVRGQNPRKIAESMQKDMGGAYYRCERIARTETIHSYNESTFQSYKNQNVTRYQFVCGLDERTCPDCGALDGKDFALSEKIEGLTFPVIHPNCVTGDSVILSPDAEKIIRSEYSGYIFKFTTSNGGGLSVTPNHIMLTARGWVRAKNLVKGDKIIRYSGWDKIGIVGNPADDDGIPAIENLFASVGKFGPMFADSVPASAKDLKGDVTKNAKIDIINVDGFLRNKLNSSFGKLFGNFRFVETDKSLEGVLPRDGTVAKFLMCVGLALDGIMSVERVLDVFFFSPLTHHQLVGLRLPSDYDSRLAKSVINDCSCDIKDFGKFIDTFSRIIQFDDIVNVERCNFSGHIYDVSSLSTLYIVNGYLSSNCRCSTVPYFPKDDVDEMFENPTVETYEEYHNDYKFTKDMTYDEWYDYFKPEGGAEAFKRKTYSEWKKEFILRD